MNKRLFIILSLGFSSGLPLALISSTLQAWFADTGMPVLITGLLSLVGLPYIFRIFWAPLVDHSSLCSLGQRRSWMLLMQTLLLIGFNIMAWLSPTTSPTIMVTLALILAIFSATQDLAIDACRIEILPFTEHGLGASFSTIGYRLALLVAGGLSLIIAQYAGWPFTYRLIGSLMLLGMITTLLTPNSPILDVKKESIRSSLIAPFKELASRPKIISLFLFIFFYKLGEAFTTMTSGIMMPFLIQGIGFSLDTISYVNNIMGVGSVLLGGLLAGYLLQRWSLYRALLTFGLMQAVTNVLFIVLSCVGNHLPTLILAVVSDNFTAGMASTALVVLFMRLVNRSFTATQFSILVAFSTLPRVLSGPLGAILQSNVGWTGLYYIAFILSLGFAPFLMRLGHQFVEDGVLSPLASNPIVAEGAD